MPWDEVGLPEPILVDGPPLPVAPTVEGFGVVTMTRHAVGGNGYYVTVNGWPEEILIDDRLLQTGGVLLKRADDIAVITVSNGVAIYDLIELRDSGEWRARRRWCGAPE